MRIEELREGLRDLHLVLSGKMSDPDMDKLDSEELKLFNDTRSLLVDLDENILELGSAFYRNKILL